MTSGKCGPLMSKTKENNEQKMRRHRLKGSGPPRADHRVELGQAGTGKNLEHLEQFGALCATRRRQRAERYLLLLSISVHLVIVHAPLGPSSCRLWSSLSVSECGCCGQSFFLSSRTRQVVRDCRSAHSAVR